MHWIVVGILIGVGVMLAPLIVGGLILAWEWICLAAAALAMGGINHLARSVDAYLRLAHVRLDDLGCSVSVERCSESNALEKKPTEVAMVARRARMTTSTARPTVLSKKHAPQSVPRQAPGQSPKLLKAAVG